MKRVFICSPYAGDITRNVAIAQEACRIAVEHDEAPFAPHLFYTQFLDDTNPSHRGAGIVCGLAFMEACHEVWAYIRDGISPGMQRELDHAKSLGLPIVEYSWQVVWQCETCKRYFGMHIEPFHTEDDDDDPLSWCDDCMDANYCGKCKTIHTVTAGCRNA